MIVATAGHVDHGKTLLIKALTGVDTSRLPEEQARGMTIDLGFAYHALAAGDGAAVIGFVDVPGHERFVRNMLAGVAAIDFVLMVVAADDGPMPQTREHLAILELLGITQGVVALTKIDRVSAERAQAAHDEVVAMLAGTPLAAMPIVATASPRGEGIAQLRTHLLAAAATLAARSSHGHFRFAIDRSFILEGAGRVVTGTIFSGALAVGDELLLASAKVPVRVRSIHAHNRPAQSAQAGTRCGLNLTGPDLRRHEIRRGDWLVAPALAPASSRLHVELQVLASETKGLRDRQPVHVHLGASDVLGRINLLASPITPGHSGLATIVLEEPVVAVRGDRFVIRDQSATRTLGGGRVLDPIATARAIPRAHLSAVLAALTHDDPQQALDALLIPLAEGIPLDWFQRSFNLQDEDIAALIAALDLITFSALKEGKLALPRVRWHALATTILAQVAAFHAANSAVAGCTEAEIIKPLLGHGSANLMRGAIADLVREGKLERRAGLLHLPGHAAVLSKSDAALWKKVEALLTAHGKQPPALHDIPELVGIPLETIRPFFERAAHQGYLLHVRKYRYFLPHTIGVLAAIAEQLAHKSAHHQFTAREYRDECGIGRNVAIEVLEYFDRIGLTLRIGETRRLRRPVAAVLGRALTTAANSP